ncbi:MAG TPA: sigma-70 family RNA polymerase sigma factor [Pseudomonadota bacterium]|nr:sigma-70 family RNA polymerase sigma factor [Pseudomonadota bacterium]HNF97328.1 sigma-70 family RNA polymerase sigma factor [Pseudomonadota bacterium]HNI59081.1 sigma-70 family RNA polymerase sigma factor [Pseudomonadota bacterium]HNK44165.1 sigma-70 family RNA polymerase sigma factor [Pseudomonadota bacterium]HNN52046.1 sigma-70 family RNA polymerase sigma factor [Pseudomonadota bacterium]
MDLRDEGELIRRLQQHDERAFQTCVRLYQDKVYGLVYRMLGSQAEAEDVAQEVFVTVFKSIDSFRGDSKFSTWLYRIAANHCKNRIKYLRRRAHKQTAELDDAAERQLFGGGSSQSTLGQQHASPVEALEGLQLSHIVQRAITKLDEEHRLLLVLRDVEELSYEEIMQVTGLPEGTVKSRLHRARLILKDEIARHTK